jgi:pentatricopeptide repeat protein
MHQEGVWPNSVTFVRLLNACASIGSLVHLQIVQMVLEANVLVGNSLVDMYANCGSIEDAWIVFNKMPS